MLLLMICRLRVRGDHSDDEVCAAEPTSTCIMKVPFNYFREKLSCNNLKLKLHVGINGSVMTCEISHGAAACTGSLQRDLGV